MLGHLAEATESDVVLDLKGIGFALTRTLERAMARFAEDPDDMERLDRIAQLAGLIGTVPFEINLWNVQNTYWDLMHTVLPEKREDAIDSDDAREWVERFEGLGETLHIVVPAWRVPVKPPASRRDGESERGDAVAGATSTPV